MLAPKFKLSVNARDVLVAEKDNGHTSLPCSMRELGGIGYERLLLGIWSVERI
jgi:hypothetical protein